MSIPDAGTVPRGREAMNDVMTMAEIESQFDSEWVLVGDPKTNEVLEVENGRVLCHSKDRDEVDRKLLELRPKRFAMLYLGKPAKDAAIVL